VSAQPSPIPSCLLTSSARLDFTNLPPPSVNSKAVGKAKQTGTGARATAPGTHFLHAVRHSFNAFTVGKAANPTAAKAKGAAAKTKLPPAKIIADSESEVDASSSDDEKDSDSEMADFEDANEEEFLAEVRLHFTFSYHIRTYTHTGSAHRRQEDCGDSHPRFGFRRRFQGMQIIRSHPILILTAKMSDAKSAKQLFDSDQESIEVRRDALYYEEGY
jgi:hypothetical protein